ncbi:MAG: cryptochrome/photolyase family protein, partial [Holosporaceae bacterium]
MSALRLILADQLSESLASLQGIDKACDVVMLCEVMEEAGYVPHHPKKIAFLFSAMRHFAAELEAKGVHVRYVKLDDAKNTGSFTGEVQRAIHELKSSTVVVTEPGEYRVLQMMKDWQRSLDIPVEILPDTRFFSTHAEFAVWAKDKKQLRMEFFYREMRKKYS